MTCARRAIPILFLSACRGNPGDTDTGGGPSDTADTLDTAAPWWAGDATDADGDGFTAAQGDCEDGDPEVWPGKPVDTCDGRDDDCDGLVDEDPAPDAQEPNDLLPTNLQDLTEIPETLIFGYLHPATDLDRFAFRVEDPTYGWFDVEAWLYGVPEGADFALDLYWTADASGTWQGLVATADARGAGGYETIDYGGLAIRDDTGWYELVVRSVEGSGCASPYVVQILTGGW